MINASVFYDSCNSFLKLYLLSVISKYFYFSKQKGR